MFTKKNGVYNHFADTSSFRAYSAGALLFPQYVAFVSSSGLSPGSREAKVQRAKVCLHCTEPSVARYSWWSLPVGRYLSDTRRKGSMVVLARTASNGRRLLVTRWESGEQPVVLLASAFDTWRVYGILKILRSAHVSNASRRESRTGTLWWSLPIINIQKP